METDPKYPIDLITSYLSGEAGEDDLKFLKAWLNADPEHVRIFNEYRNTWLELERERIEGSINIDNEWKALTFRLKTDKVNTPSGAENHVVRMLTPRMWRIAALILILLIPSFILIRYLATPATRQLVATLAVTRSTLPDGTVVTLNKDAVLEYPSSFRGSTRTVILRGEAWFEVKHDKSKPFIIQCRNVKLEVLGTTFNVNSGKAGTPMEVILNSGSLAVYFDSSDQGKLILGPGEKAAILPEQGKMSKDVNPDPNYLAWMTQQFVYKHEPLISIIAAVNKVYHKNFVISSPLVAHCLVTATFDHQSPESIINVLRATLDLHISDHGSWTEISGKKCN